MLTGSTAAASWAAPHLLSVGSAVLQRACAHWGAPSWQLLDDHLWTEGVSKRLGGVGSFCLPREPGGRAGSRSVLWAGPWAPPPLVAAYLGHVAVIYERLGAGDGGGGHVQHVGRRGGLGKQAPALLHAKPGRAREGQGWVGGGNQSGVTPPLSNSPQSSTPIPPPTPVLKTLHANGCPHQRCPPPQPEHRFHFLAGTARQNNGKLATTPQLQSRTAECSLVLLVHHRQAEASKLRRI